MQRHLIPAGGPTQQKSAPGVTEAGLMGKYLQRQVVIRSDIQLGCFYETNSYTTLENIKGASKYIGYLNLKNSEVVIICGYGCHLNRELTRYLDKIAQYLNESEVNPGVTIFCEFSRRFKVRLLSLLLLRRWVQIRTVSWERAHPIFQLFSMMAEVSAVFIPKLQTYFRNKKIQRALNI